MTEYENEPIRGLPGLLPPGERILWQGAPEWRALARTAFHTRLIAGYFLLLVGWATVSALTTKSGYLGIQMTLVLGVVGVALLHLLAYAVAKTTVYTLTDRRVVLRIGIAVPKCVNLPLGMIASVDLATNADSTGDVCLVVTGPAKLGVLALWPHTRPWKIAKPQPMLRAVADARTVAALVARTCTAMNGDVSLAASPPRAQRTPAFTEAATA